MPAFNAERWIGDAVNSVLRQTHADFELIIVDDDSTDSTCDIAHEFAAHDRRIRVLHQSRAGAAAARNTALRNSHGDYIQYLDADDLLSPSKLESQVNLLSSRRNNLSNSVLVPFIDNPPSKLDEVMSWHQPFCAFDFELERLQQRMRHDFIHNWLVPRVVNERAGEWDESLTLNDDGEFFCRVRLAASQIVFDGRSHALYRLDVPNSVSKGRTRRDYESALRAAVSIEQNILAREDTRRTRTALAYNYQYVYRSMYPNCPDLCRQILRRALSLGVGFVPMSDSRVFRRWQPIFGFQGVTIIHSLFFRGRKRLMGN